MSKLQFSWPIWPLLPQNWPTINQIYDIFVTSYMKYLWLRYTMKATELVQITLQLLQYVMHAGVALPNDSVLWLYMQVHPNILLMSSCYKYIQQWIESWGKKRFFPANLEQH